MQMRCALLALVCGVSVVFASNTGTIRLDVKDPAGAPMAVTGKVSSNVLTRNFQTDAAGTAELVQLPFGRYRIDLTKTGFAHYSLQVAVTGTQPMTRSIEMSLEGTSYKVDVVGATPLAGIDLTVLSVFGGALGVGLGFGLQKIASNYVSGFIILLDRSIRIGDWITADNHYGEVRQITTRYTVVRSLSGVEAIIPNDMLVTATVLNNTYADKQLRLAVKVSVAYSTAIEPVLELLAEIASRHPRVLKEPPPNAIVTALGDNGIELELGFWIEDPEKGRQNLCSEISVAILSEFRTRRIEIPYPQREVRILPGGAA